MAMRVRTVLSPNASVSFAALVGPVRGQQPAQTVLVLVVYNDQRD